VQNRPKLVYEQVFAKIHPSIFTVCCYIKVGKNLHKILAILDTGCSSTIIDALFAKKYNLPVITGPIMKHVQYVDRPASYETVGVAVTLVAQDQQVQFQVEAQTVKDLSKNCGLYDWSVEIQNYDYMKNVIIPDYPYPPVATMIIGTNNISLLNDDLKRIGGPNDPVAKKTPLGWGFMGPIADTQEDEQKL